MVMNAMILLVIGILAVGTSRGDGDIGCLFSSSLCNEHLEWCYDDYAFGHCLPMYGQMDDQELYHYDLNKNDLLRLEGEIQKLFSLGYHWRNIQTQCVLKNMLLAIKNGDEYDESLCHQWASKIEEAPLKSVEKLTEPIEDDAKVHASMAFVRYQPSSDNPHPEFADEVYFPTLNGDEVLANLIVNEPTGTELAERQPPQYSYPNVNGIEKKYFHHPPKRSMLMSRLLPPSGIFSPLYNTPDKFRAGFETRDGDLSLVEQNPGENSNNDEELLIAEEENVDLPRYEAGVGETIRRLVDEEPTRNGPQEELTDMIDNEKPSILLPEGHGFVSGFKEYNTPGKFRLGIETRDAQPNELEITLEEILKGPSNDLPPLEKYQVSQDDGTNYRLSPKLGRLANLLYKEDKASGAAYTEGGLVILPNQNKVEARDLEVDKTLDDGLDAILGFGFKRPERLDVKKPGPLFTVMNLAEQQAETLKQKVLNNASRQQQNVIKKTPDGFRPTPDVGQFDVVDTTFAYIGFKQRPILVCCSLTSWHEGRNIVRVVAELLGLPPGTLSHPRVDRNEVTFKVEPNSLRMNSSEVAKKIEGIKDALKLRTGVEVTSAGIGDKTKLPTVLSLAPDSDHELWIATFLLIGVVGSVIIGAATLFFIKRHSKSRNKLRGLAGADTEAVGDYQDLCRARMTGKTGEKSDNPIGQRIASLSRESESNNSPSSRSSTSSWSEEPALTNMDISTGHMVLSYMEDHLKNKDRLDQEWIALCAYEAEPCAVIHALKPDNVTKNRYAECLPYDHSRVVLNDLANMSGADYINASTITDHDPRSPAYIATQGPLPHTAPHFWQLVWEQGSVVMVMLTRLTEDGNAMCHRYWPEEGSELYHIYEVHLVSEHIWCDDYLVRSFYLKNLKTGETRTVTQFHFLSWPDNSVPVATKALLEFRRKVNKSYRGRSCPIVVHCSDGVGRTGTYCLIDMVLNRMAKGAKEIDIAATLEHIRDQRANMVKTKEQFEFVLMAVAEEVNAILKALPAQQQQPQVTPPLPVTQ